MPCHLGPREVLPLFEDTVQAINSLASCVGLYLRFRLGDIGVRKSQGERGGEGTCRRRIGAVAGKHKRGRKRCERGHDV